MNKNVDCIKVNNTYLDRYYKITGTGELKLDSYANYFQINVSDKNDSFSTCYLTIYKGEDNNDYEEPHYNDDEDDYGETNYYEKFDNIIIDKNDLIDTTQKKRKKLLRKIIK